MAQEFIKSPDFKNWGEVDKSFDNIERLGKNFIEPSFEHLETQGFEKKMENALNRKWVDHKWEGGDIDAANKLIRQNMIVGNPRKLSPSTSIKGSDIFQLASPMAVGTGRSNPTVLGRMYNTIGNPDYLKK